MNEPKEPLLRYAIRALVFTVTLAVIVILLWFVMVVLWQPIG